MVETLGNLGDFIGGIGVLVSLVYLAIQVRQNTKASKADSYQDAVAAANEWSRQIGADREMCELIQRGSLDYAGLESVDRMQFNLLMSSYFRNMENIHAKYESGVIEDRAWGGWAMRLGAFLATPGVAEYWRRNEAAFSTGFRELLNGELPRVEKAEGPADFAPSNP